MAKIISCDGGCGAQSPSKDGHVANNWFTVRAWSPKEHRFSEPDKYNDKQFCKACAPRVIEALKPLHVDEGRAS